MKKSSMALIGVVVIIVVAVAGFLLTHKSASPSNSTSSSNSSAQAVNNAVLKTKTDSSLGQYLTDPNGLPLYTYGADSSGVSNCTGTCLANWPAYQDKSTTTGLPAGVGTLKRSDNGQTQYTYNGLPLYTFVGDSAGKVTGNGIDNFKVAKPVAGSSSSSSSASTSSQSSSGNAY